MRRSDVQALVVMLAMLFGCVPVNAQERSASERAVAREQFQLGVDAARNGRWNDARDAFARAYAIVQRPLILFNLAGAQVRSGQLVAGAESYRRFLVDSTQGEGFEQRGAAEQALRQTDDRIARVLIHAAGLLDRDVLAIDGSVVAVAAFAVPLPVDPGEHVVTVTLNDRERVRVPFSVAESEHRVLELQLPVEPSPPARSAQPDVVDAVVSPTNTAHDPRVALDVPRERHGVLASPLLWSVIGVVVIGGIAVGAGVYLTNHGFVGNVGQARVR